MDIRLADGGVDLAGRVVVRGAMRAQLTPREVDLLTHLAAHPGVCPFESVLTEVWGYARTARTQAVHVAVRRLRAKLEVDPGDPVHLLTVPGVGWELVPAVAPSSAAHGLLGRDTALAALAAADGPLVTVVGPGGVGKTRLVRALLADHPGRFVDLSAATDRAGVRDRVLEGRPPDSLAAEPTVLDNAEHVVDACAALVAEWRDAVPGARFVVTSRVPLRLTDEQVLRLGPLPTADGVALFERRARAAGVDARGDPAVAQLVERLDGNPLAIELAAARSPVLPPAALLARGTADLRARSRDRPARHTSVDAVVAWSVDLLDAGTRRALVDLQAFVGGFTLAAAEAVLGPVALDAVHDLVDASLLRPLAPGRFGPWVTVAAYLERRHDPSPEALRRHGAHLAALGRRVRDGAEVAPSTWHAEAADTRVALARAVEAGDLALVPDLCVAVGEAAAARVSGEAVGWLVRARALLPADPVVAYGLARALCRTDPARAVPLAGAALAAEGPLRWRAHTVLLEVLRDASRFVELREAATEALDVAATASERAEALVHRATAHRRLGDGDAGLADLAAAAAQPLADAVEGLVRAARGSHWAGHQQWARAQSDFEAALACYAAAGDRMNEGAMLGNLATALHYQRRHAEAAARAERAVAVLEDAGWVGRTASPLVVMAEARRGEGRLEDAAALLHRAGRVARAAGNRAAFANSRSHLAMVLRQAGDLGGADAVLVEGLATAEALGARPLVVELLTLRGEVALDDGRVADAVAALAEAERRCEGLAAGANARRTVDWLRDRLAAEA